MPRLRKSREAAKDLKPGLFCGRLRIEGVCKPQSLGKGAINKWTHGHELSGANSDLTNDDRTSQPNQRTKKGDGGGGNRTRVRRHFNRGYYMLSISIIASPQ